LISLKHFDGYEVEVKRAFSWAFNGVEVEIVDVKLILTESIVAKATFLPRNGESWFKNRKIKEKDWTIFLQNPGMDTSIFKKEMLVTTFKTKWRIILLII